jgi:branched-chain amino acid transport system ATP-binding protein
VLVLNEVHARYGAITALRGVSIEVGEGELVALLGVNGAGKSTLLGAIAGILRPWQGSITFEGKSIVGKTPEQITRLGIALVPEGRDIFPSLTTEENLRLGAYTRQDRVEYQRDLEEMFRLFPVLGERRGQLGGTLSGGEQQQLAIARALMSHPRLLMLDEPSLGLAPALVDQIFELVARLHQSGVTILLVEQNVDRSLAIVDRAYLLNTGSIEISGTPAELRTHADIEGIYMGDRRRNFSAERTRDQL